MTFSDHDVFLVRQREGNRLPFKQLAQNYGFNPQGQNYFAVRFVGVALIRC